MLGCNVEDILGSRVTDFIFEEDILNHEARMKAQRRMLGGKYKPRFRRTDGAGIPIHIYWMTTDTLGL